MATAQQASLDVYVLPGNSSRQIDAPYYLLDDGSSGNEGPRRSIVGNFSGTEGYRDIAAFTQSAQGTARLWLLPTGDDASIEPVSAKPTSPRPAALPMELQAATDALLGNLGPRTGATVDEIVIAAGPSTSSTSTNGLTLLTTTTATGNAFDTPPDPEHLDGFSITEGAAITGQMITARVLGKDRPDVVLASASDGLAVVPWDPVTGKLDVKGVKQLALKALKDLRCDADDLPVGGPSVIGLAALRLDDSGKQALVVSLPSGTHLVTWDGSALVPTCMQTTSRDADGDAYNIGAGFAVTTGDFDGDGIDDVIVGQRTGLVVYYGAAVKPGDGPAAVAASNGGAQ
ncbi:MAG: hypothetical protein QM820_42895 [Minicystis sp.]